MWTAAQIGLCLVVCLGVAFFLGRWLGRRRFFKVQEEMKALETSFNHLLEQMELVSDHNLKVLQTKTEELRELLHITDKKCLYANDLLQEFELGHRELQNRLTAQPASLPAPTDLKMRRELQETTDSLNERIRCLEARLEAMEAALQGRDAIADQMTTRHAAVAGSSNAPFPPAGFSPPPPPLESVQPAVNQGFAPSPAQTTREKVVPMKWREDPLPHPLSVFISGIEGSPRIPHQRDPEPREQKMHFSPPVETPSNDEPSDPSIPMPTPGTPFYEVLKLAKEGVTIPQIARLLQMGKGEVELIMNLYGARPQRSMRKVM